MAGQQTRKHHKIQPLTRRIGGWSLIGLGLLGTMLPVLPGVVLIALGVVLLGPHDPTLRRIALTIRLLLRRWSQIKQPHLRRIGMSVRRQHYRVRMTFQEHLRQHECDERHWRAYFPILGYTLLGLIVSVTVTSLLWAAIP